MILRFYLELEIERRNDTLSDALPVKVQLTYERGKWRAQAQDPPITTLLCDSMEEAIIAAGREVTADWHLQRQADQ